MAAAPDVTASASTTGRRRETPEGGAKGACVAFGRGSACALGRTSAAAGGGRACAEAQSGGEQCPWGDGRGGLCRFLRCGVSVRGCGLYLPQHRAAPPLGWDLVVFSAGVHLREVEWPSPQRWGGSEGRCREGLLVGCGGSCSFPAEPLGQWGGRAPFPKEHERGRTPGCWMLVECLLCLQSVCGVGAFPGSPEEHHLVPLGTRKRKALGGVGYLEINLFSSTKSVK